MEFLPMEKYSSDRKRGKHKKDVKRLEKKAAVKERKAGRKVKTTKNVTPVEEEVVAGKSEKNFSESEEEFVKESSKRPVKNKKIPNRLFVNMKKKIMDVQEVKDLHPNIVSVTLPRKKRSSWCWAVFESKEKLVQALKVLKKRKDIIVNEMFSDETRKEKRIKKLEKVKVKKAMKRTLKETWT